MKANIKQYIPSDHHCRMSVRKPGAGLRACGAQAVGVRVIQRSKTTEVLYFCGQHTPGTDEPDPKDVCTNVDCLKRGDTMMGHVHRFNPPVGDYSDFIEGRLDR